MMTASWILRVAVFGTFFGHGLLAFQGNPTWIHYLTFWGFTVEAAEILMPIIGVIDILLAISVVIKPLRPVLIYAFIWAFATALMRWIADANVLGFVERAANWGAPLALLLLQHRKK
jgi:hypothetical protein